MTRASGGLAVVGEPPGTAEFIRAASEAGRAVAIVSNNSAPAVLAYLTAQDLVGYVLVVVGRAYAAAARMKPNPEPVLDALAQLGAEAARSVLLGDSATDVHAAHASGVPCIGYANWPTKHSLLSQAGADAVVDSLGELTAVLGLHEPRG